MASIGLKRRLGTLARSNTLHDGCLALPRPAPPAATDRADDPGQDLSALLSENLPAGTGCRAGRAMRRGLVVDSACLPSPSSMTLNRKCSGSSNDETQVAVPRDSQCISRRATVDSAGPSPRRMMPTRPPKDRDAIQPFPRAISQQYDGLHRDSSWVAESPKHKSLLSNEEVLQEFYSAVDPSRHHHRFTNFLPTYRRFIHPDFVICTGEVKKSRSEWEPYWELMVMTGAVAQDLQLLVEDGDEVVYSVNLKLGASIISLTHVAQFRDSQLYRLHEPEAAADGAGGGRAQRSRSSPRAAHQVPEYPLSDDSSGLSTSSVDGFKDSRGDDVAAPFHSATSRLAVVSFADL